MEVDLKMISKLPFIAAAAATAAVAAAPAMADHGRHRGHDGIDAGDVIAGALIIGGIAAVASASSRGNGGYHERYDGNANGYYRNGYGSRVAVEQCVRAAERDASRYGRARITDVTSINRIRGGYEVRGRLVVAGRSHWARGYDGWDRYGYRYDRYGRDYDKGKFSCLSRFGNIEDVRLSGLRPSY